MKYTKNQIRDGLIKASSRHAVLKAHFDTFANSVIAQITAPQFSIKGMQAEAILEDSYFVVIFAGRELVFAFESVADSVGQTLNGVIKCYLDKEYPTDAHGIFGEVTFNGNGETNLKSLDNPGDPVMLSQDTDALFLVLELIYESLEK